MNKQRIEAHKVKLHGLVALKDSIQAQLEESQQTLREVARGGDLIRDARSLFLEVAEGCQTEVLEKVTGILGHSLREILGDDAYSAKVKQSQKRKTPTASIKIGDGDYEATDLLNERGGGIAVITSLILAVILQTRINPTGSRTFVLDETLNFISRDRLPALNGLLAKLCDKGCQFVIVTHQPEITGDTEYRLEQVNGVTTAKRIK